MAIEKLTVEEAEKKLQFERRKQKGRVTVDYRRDPESGELVLSDADAILADFGYLPRRVRIVGGVLQQADLPHWPGEIQLHALPLEGWGIARFRHGYDGGRKVGTLLVRKTPSPDGVDMRTLYYNPVDGNTKDRARWLADYATADPDQRKDWLSKWSATYFDGLPIAEGTLSVGTELDTV